MKEGNGNLLSNDEDPIDVEAVALELSSRAGLASSEEAGPEGPVALEFQR